MRKYGSEIEFMNEEKFTYLFDNAIVLCFNFKICV
jgi:hypothetical protein